MPYFLVGGPVPPSDPDDEVFLICAIDGHADYLVSEDRDLLSLKDSYQRPVNRPNVRNWSAYWILLAIDPWASGAPPLTQSLKWFTIPNCSRLENALLG